MRTIASISHMTALGLLAALSGTASAAWEKIVDGHNSSAYVDRASIRRSDGRVAMQVLIDYQKPPFDGNNLPYLSLTMRNEYHCIDGQFRVLLITSHAQHMGLGPQPYKTDEPGEWESISTTSIQRPLWETACEKKLTAASADRENPTASDRHKPEHKDSARKK